MFFIFASIFTEIQKPLSQVLILFSDLPIKYMPIKVKVKKAMINPINWFVGIILKLIKDIRSLEWLTYSKIMAKIDISISVITSMVRSNITVVKLWLMGVAFIFFKTAQRVTSPNLGIAKFTKYPIHNAIVRFDFGISWLIWRKSNSHLNTLKK